MKNSKSQNVAKLYSASSKNYYRYLLGSAGKKPLFVIGLNPSTADNMVSDRTISKVKRYSEKNRFDGFIMLNLYPQRKTKPKELHRNLIERRHNQNISAISEILNRYNDISILAAWGDNIEIRPYLSKCLADIFKITKHENIKWLKLGSFTNRGHPRHPGRGPYYQLTKFNIEKYPKTL